MRKIEILTSSSWQESTIRLEGGGSFQLILRFVENQSGWFYDIVHDDLTLRGRRLVTSLNLLRAFRNVVDFGIAVHSTDKHEPVFVDDFVKERVSVYTLTSDDVVGVESNIASIS